MRLYLDDDSADPHLVRLLRNAGHEVRVPADVNMSGQSDSVHLTHAIRDNWICLTRNFDDFEDLHNLVLESGGHHPGIVIVRQDNDPTRDLTLKGIVRALRRLEDSRVPLPDCCYVLNHWR